MNVPSTDFMALMYIVPPPLHRCEPVSSLKRGADSLETAKFVDFWQVINVNKSCDGDRILHMYRGVGAEELHTRVRARSAVIGA